MELIKQLIDINDRKNGIDKLSKITEGKKDISELVEKYMEQEGMHNMEGPRGVRNLEKLVKVLDPYYNDLNYFLQDNYGAIEALIEWIGTKQISDWVENLEKELTSNTDEETDIS